MSNPPWLYIVPDLNRRAMSPKVKGFVSRVLSLGSKDQDAVRRRALAIFAAVQGAQLVARSRGNATVYDEVVQTYREGGLFP